MEKAAGRKARAVKTIASRASATTPGAAASPPFEKRRAIAPGAASATAAAAAATASARRRATPSQAREAARSPAPALRPARGTRAWTQPRTSIDSTKER